MACPRRVSALATAALTAVALLVIISSLSAPAEAVAATEKGAPVAFQAEVSKMLDILINSLYTNRAIFLRELISNGSDALDKIRVMYLKAKKEPVNDDGTAPTMDIRISVDDKAKQLTIRDGGVGMTKDELSGHLGSLGTSGTKKFLEQLQEHAAAGAGGSGNNLIGQFGVGFYSVFLVADRVRVASKSDDSDVQYVWESAGNGQFYLYEDPRGNTLGRGTEIVIDLKPDAAEYANADTIKRVIHQYSEFINFPIFLQVEKKPTVTPTSTEDGEDHPIVEEAVEKPKEYEWKRVNENRPIWTRPLADVTEDEYNSFYKSLTKDFKKPMYYSHFKVEGEVEFDSILFIPEEPSMDMFMDDTSTSNNIKLYVRRVFITDDFRDLLPRYLNFIRGVVDSNDLPLNVSREVLQENRIMRVIKKKLIRKALLMISDIAAQDQRLAELNATGRDISAHTTQPGTKLLKEPTYATFWEKFGKHLRYGVIQDSSNRGRLTKLLRYRSSKSEDVLVSLDEYMARMHKGQKGIYYLSGDSVEKIRQSPVLQDAIQRDVEVLYMTDAIDEYVVAHVPDFSGKKLVNLAKEGVQFDDADPRQRAIEKKRDERYAEFLTSLRRLFGFKQVRKAVLTKRYTKEAFILSSSEHQMTARLANLVRGQAMAFDPSVRTAERVLEVNYRHPLVSEIFHRLSVDEADEVAKDLAWVLYDTANLQAEFPVDDIAAYATRVNRLLRSSVDIAADDALLPADDAEYLEAIEEEERNRQGATPLTDEAAEVEDMDADEMDL